MKTEVIVNFPLLLRQVVILYRLQQTVFIFLFYLRKKEWYCYSSPAAVYDISASWALHTALHL